MMDARYSRHNRQRGEPATYHFGPECASSPAWHLGLPTPRVGFEPEDKTGDAVAPLRPAASSFHPATSQFKRRPPHVVLGWRL